MVKKVTGKKNHREEILDDNGTLISAASDVPGETARGADKGDAPAAKRDLAGP
ncbi:MAG TPA: hypothetical protein VGB04_03715 [Allosphingosinicella sp.]|jgi:hypothetical protein